MQTNFPDIKQFCFTEPDIDIIWLGRQKLPPQATLVFLGDLFFVCSLRTLPRRYCCCNYPGVCE
jgi:hypothetical protein